MLRTSRRLLLNSALTLPLTNLARAEDLPGPLTPEQRRRLVFTRRTDSARQVRERQGQRRVQQQSA